ncbi:hypothetical protein B0T10DRAFT_462468 [Thelonectria olida]|uniref:Uncharacterized protein n=1 Tax=Thelonectria olida TaxID=1576542 RepID=A0A9P9AMV8_9HYPO|nr:hypothetical protein B0T10DRAFT_462468 [Thelonectria olida]
MGPSSRDAQSGAPDKPLRLCTYGIDEAACTAGSHARVPEPLLFLLFSLCLLASSPPIHKRQKEPSSLCWAYLQVAKVQTRALSATLGVVLAPSCSNGRVSKLPKGRDSLGSETVKPQFPRRSLVDYLPCLAEE